MTQKTGEKRIISVSSDEGIRERIESLLKHEDNFEVEVGGDASLAVSGARERKLDCVIIFTTKCEYAGFSVYKGKKAGDYFYEKKGVQAILDLRAQNPKQKVIAITSNPYTEFHQYLEEIADGFFEMVFDFEKLKGKIWELCGEEELGEKEEVKKESREIYSPLYSEGASLGTGPFFKRPKRRY
ncbi:MAG: hypothetical protein WC435_03805 [Candidatus Paceibacterota bacterium]